MTPINLFAVFNNGSNSLQHYPVFQDADGKQYVIVDGNDGNCNYRLLSSIPNFLRFEKQ